MEWIAVNLPIILPLVAIPFVMILVYVYQKEMRFAQQRLAQANTIIERLFQNSSDGVIMFDVSGRITSINKAAERMYHWSNGEAKGKILPMVPPSRRDRVLKRLQSTSPSNLFVNLDTQHTTSTGQTIDLNVTWSALTTESDALEGFLLIARDLTDIRRLEQELLHLTDQLVSLNTLSKCLAGSTELRPTMETAVVELMSTLKLSYCQINSVVSESGDLLPTLRLGIAPMGMTETLELLVREAEQSQGSILKGLIAALPIRVLDRTVGSMLAVFEDDLVIEKRLKVVETFTQQVAAVLYAVTLLHKERETTERMTELTRLRGDFVAMVSHELRTPLTCIKGFVDTLLRPGIQWDAEDQAEFLQSIKVSTEQALNVVEDLLAIQQAEYGKLSIHREPLDLILLVEEACRRAQSLSHNHAIRWSVPSQHFVIKADATRLTQVMDNLLSNAIKYSPLGGDVVVKVKHQEGCVEVSVEDTGIGIEPEHQALIFEKFFRADNTAARRTEGLGLGLSIVQAVVTLHGGQVWLTSTPNKGSIFYFSLPSQG